MTTLKEWMTAAEIAALRLYGLPTTESSVIRLAKRQRWRQSNNARCRSGRGGGWEYHVSLLPAASLAALDASQEYGDLTALLATVAPWQGAAMKARAALLAEIDRIALAARCSRSRAVDTLREALADGSASPQLIASARDASERAGIPSRSHLFSWLRIREAAGLAGLAPHPKRVPRTEDGARQAARIAERLSQERVQRAANILAGLTAAEQDRALATQRTAVLRYVKSQGWGAPADRV